MMSTMKDFKDRIDYKPFNLRDKRKQTDGKNGDVIYNH